MSEVGLSVIETSFLSIACRAGEISSSERSRRKTFTRHLAVARLPLDRPNKTPAVKDSEATVLEPGEGGGGNTHLKQTGMLVVSLRGVNFGFWSRLGCSGQSANILCRQGLV